MHTKYHNFKGKDIHSKKNFVSVKIYFIANAAIYLNSHLLDDLPISFNTQIGTQLPLHAKLHSFSKFKSVPTFIYRLKATSAWDV